ncbi:hypothetical protein [Oceanobacter mangrovi]|uniref:hypothetical protein n=1 Tax=Oceanobacter mangrovi TaxID=2862510 RepID=UPI001C8D36AB|nr:hypothetical protein [Oceanobacter mangrovi]
MQGKKQEKRGSLCVVNDRFEPVFNTAEAMQIENQRPARQNKNFPALPRTIAENICATIHSIVVGRIANPVAVKALAPYP